MEEHYPRIEKLAFSLVMSTQRLRPYFQAHTIKVLTECSLRKILQKPNLSGRLVSWEIELGEFDIEFHPRTSLKGQALANFKVEFCNMPEEEMASPEETWIIYVDGSSTRRYSGAGVTRKGPNKEDYEVVI